LNTLLNKLSKVVKLHKKLPSSWKLIYKSNSGVSNLETREVENYSEPLEAIEFVEPPRSRDSYTLPSSLVPH
jgi:hypothetical protein